MIKLLESTASSRLISHKANISGEWVSRWDSQWRKFEWKPLMLVQLTFRDMCNSGPTGLVNLDIKAIFVIVHSGKKSDSWWFRYFSEKLTTNQAVLICEPTAIATSKLVASNCTPQEVAVGIHLHAWHGTKTTVIFFSLMNKKPLRSLDVSSVS